MSDEDVYDRYYSAGLSDEEASAVTELAAVLESADPVAGAYVAVQRRDVRYVLAALDRLVDAAAR